MIQFHDTGYGRKFFEYQLPKLINSLERLANAIEEGNKIVAGQTEAEPKSEDNDHGDIARSVPRHFSGKW